MHQEILDTNRLAALPAIAQSGQGFYLAGGTALALQLGHRDSIDFDFFRAESFAPEELFQHVSSSCVQYEVSKLQEETDTLTVLLDGEIQLSFFSYPYPVLQPPTVWQDLAIASVVDIAAMKLSAITSRATFKDYVDLCLILKTHSLSELLAACKEKFPNLNQTLVLKSLVYFADMTDEPVLFMPGHEMSMEAVKTFLEQTVRDFNHS